MNRAEKYKKHRIDILKKNVDLKKKIYMLGTFVKLVYVLKAAKRLLANLSMLKEANSKKIFALLQCRAVVHRHARTMFKHYGEDGVKALLR